MITQAMPLLMNADGQHLEFRNAADEVVLPSTQLKSGEDARAAAKRAVEEFFGFAAPEDAVKEGFQARVGNDVVAVYPIDVQKMEMNLLRPAESIATWAWRDVPASMGNVVALGFPRNLGERRNAADEAAAEYGVLADLVAGKAAAMKSIAPHERAARLEELSQSVEDLRLLAADLGVAAPVTRRNAADGGAKKYTTARALIRQNDGTILAARQKDGRSLLPGGHLENGETPEAAVARELQEEFGLDIKSALTGETYDFDADDNTSHRVFVVDGGKLDLSQLTPGDDVADAEFVNSPFTDSHGTVHPAEMNGNEASGDVQEIERHVEGIAHEIGELERRNAAETAAAAHTYPDRVNGAFPVLLCNAGGNSSETIATQETADGWRCEACGDVVAGPPKPELVVEGA